MQNDFVFRNIRRCNRNIFIANSIFALLIIVIICISWIKLYNLLFGPFVLTDQMVLSIPAVPIEKDFSRDDQKDIFRETFPLEGNHYINSNRFFFSLPNKEFYHSGLEYHLTSKLSTCDTTISDSKSLIAEYLLVAVKDKVLVVKSPSQQQPCLTGVFRPLYPDLTQAILKENSKYLSQEKLLPFVLDTSFSMKREFQFESSLIFVMILISLGIYGWCVYRFVNIYHHPVLKRLGRYRDVSETIDNIGSEITEYYGPTPKERYLETPHWLIHNGLFRIIIRHR